MGDICKATYWKHRGKRIFCPASTYANRVNAAKTKYKSPDVLAAAFLLGVFSADDASVRAITGCSRLPIGIRRAPTLYEIVCFILYFDHGFTNYKPHRVPPIRMMGAMALWREMSTSFTAFLQEIQEMDIPMRRLHLGAIARRHKQG